eukprot:sb/3472510/
MLSLCCFKGKRKERVTYKPVPPSQTQSKPVDCPTPQEPNQYNCIGQVKPQVPPRPQYDQINHRPLKRAQMRYSLQSSSTINEYAVPCRPQPTVHAPLHYCTSLNLPTTPTGGGSVRVKEKGVRRKAQSLLIPPSPLDYKQNTTQEEDESNDDYFEIVLLETPEKG